MLALLSALTIWLLFELPSMVRPDRVDPLALRFTLEILLLLGLRSLACRPGRWRWLRPAIYLLAGLFAVARLNEVIFFYLMRQEPLLYDQLFMLRHALVLISDLWSWQMALGLAAALLAVVAAIVLVRRLWRRVEQGLDGRSAVLLRRSYAVALALGLVLSFVPVAQGRPLVRWQSMELAGNLIRSVELYRAVEGGIHNSPYRHFEALELSQRPNVYLFFVESYGRLLSSEPSLRRAWRAELEGMERRLVAAGLHSVSAFSEAPVSGGRSWLAEATVLTGIRVRYQAEFAHLVSRMHETPNLVSFLARNGYHTLLLAPSVRVRPGIEEVNDYDYAQMLTYNELDYRGRQYGWGLVPDQFSLGRARELVLDDHPGPLFLNVHLVSSHAPWTEIPNLLEDWRDLQPSGQDAPELEEERGSKVSTDRLSRYSRPESTAYPYMGDMDDKKARNYWHSIRYDLALIEEFITGLDRDALVIVMGDHQPPLISPEHADFEVPVHILSRDPSLLEPLVAEGFAEGLRPGLGTSIRHEGLFSLLVRVLSRKRANYRPEGLRF